MEKEKIYFDLKDIRRLYIKLNYGSKNGARQFMKEAKKLTTKREKKYFFEDEEALFRLFKQEVPGWINIRNIKCWNDLVKFMDKID